MTLKVEAAWANRLGRPSAFLLWKDTAVRLLIVGAGSTGGYLGGRLIEASRDVTFLVRPHRMAQLRETGLRIASPHGDVTLHPTLVTVDELRQTYDAILLAVKDY
jgi:2-dehydropantoate 2-reductase